MTFPDFLTKAQNGELEAVEWIISDFASSIEDECYRFGLWENPDWSHSDLIQEVVFRVLTKLDQFKGGQTDNPKLVFDKWIRTTARNVVSNLHRHRNAKRRSPEKRHQVFDELTQSYFANRGGKTASSIFVRDEDAQRLRTAMAECLDEDGQRILNLRVVEGMSLTEVSEHLSLTYDQVRYKFEKSLEKLEKRLLG